MRHSVRRIFHAIFVLYETFFGTITSGTIGLKEVSCE